VSFLLLAGAIVFGVYQQGGFGALSIVEGKIVDINYFTASEDTAYVDYVFQGTSYSHIALSDFSSSFYVGEVLQIVVDPNNPASVHTLMGLKVIYYILWAAWALALLLSVGSLTYGFIHERTFAPSRKENNRKKARLSCLETLPRGRFVLVYTYEGVTYRSPSCKGNYALIDAIMRRDQDLESEVYLDSKGHFTVDFPKLNDQLEKLQAEYSLVVQ
jgi:hypothetical protein